MVTVGGRTSEVPGGVVLLLQRATTGGLLGSVEEMSAALMEAGWVRRTGSGSWSYDADAFWSVESAGHPPSLSIFAHGDHECLLRLAGVVEAVLASGQVGAVQAGEPNPDWSAWSGGGVVFTLYIGLPRQLGKRRIDALLQLAVERADAPPEALAPDPQRARRLARGGSVIVRWYLAGENHLPDDVVALLAADNDPAVVAALHANESQRRLAREQ